MVVVMWLIQYRKHRIALHLASSVTDKPGEQGTKVMTELDKAADEAIKAAGSVPAEVLPNGAVGVIEWLAILAPAITAVISALTAKISACGGPSSATAAAQIASPAWSQTHIRAAANDEAKSRGLKGDERRQCRDRIVAGVNGISAEQKQKALDEIKVNHDDGLMF